MIIDNFSGSDFRSLGKRNVIIKPRRLHQTLLTVFHMTRCPVYHESHAVYDPYLGFNTVCQINAGRFLRNKLGLRGHDGLAGRALRQLIPAQVAQVLILHCREHQQLHEPLYEGRFACADRPYYAYVNLSACSRLNILVYIKIVHKYTPLLCFYSICRGV